jgi:general secretion pathway protein G
MAFRTATGRSRGACAAGFTLIELLVVMAIIATLLTIAVPRYFRSLERARETTLRQDLAVMRDAIDKFAGDTGRLPESIEELVTQRYLRTLPEDPITKSSATWVIVKSEDAEVSGMRDIRSGAEGLAESGEPFSEL